VQVSQPRQPCFKLAAHHGVKELALWVQETGKTGFYLRVLEEGEVGAGDGIALVERPRRMPKIPRLRGRLPSDAGRWDACRLGSPW